MFKIHLHLFSFLIYAQDIQVVGVFLEEER